ncbi:MAG: metal-dependent hydrolase [Candidatus Aureabacteria bacterium]|nr:metal-dependent hydrolase [Candidatus Auribacterota bacterium]
MTAPTHIFASVVYLLLAALMLRCLDLSWPYIAFTVLSGLISDIDNPKSIIGFLFQRFVYAISLRKLDLSKILEHRGFTHSLLFCFISSIILYCINPKLISYFSIGFISHLYLDSCQKKGIKLFGFGNFYGRFSLKRHIPLRSSSEYYVLSSFLLVILLCSLIISKGGTNHLLRKALGTLKVTIEDIRELKDYRLFLIIKDGNQKKEYEIVDCLGKDIIIILKDNIPLSYGTRKDCNINSDDKKSYVKKKKKIHKVTFPFILKDKTLGHLQNKIDSSYPYYLTGNATLKKPVEIPYFINRYNSITGGGDKLNFSFLRIEDLQLYGIEDTEVKFGDFKVTYKVLDGQDVSSLMVRINKSISNEIEEAEKRIAKLRRILSNKDLTTEVQRIFDVKKDEESIYTNTLRKKAQKLLEQEENYLSLLYQTGKGK